MTKALRPYALLTLSLLSLSLATSTFMVGCGKKSEDKPAEIPTYEDNAVEKDTDKLVEKSKFLGSEYDLAKNDDTRCQHVVEDADAVILQCDKMISLYHNKKFKYKSKPNEILSWKNQTAAKQAVDFFRNDAVAKKNEMLARLKKKRTEEAEAKKAADEAAKKAAAALNSPEKISEALQTKATVEAKGPVTRENIAGEYEGVLEYGTSSSRNFTKAEVIEALGGGDAYIVNIRLNADGSLEYREYMNEARTEGILGGATSPACSGSYRIERGVLKTHVDCSRYSKTYDQEIVLGDVTMETLSTVGKTVEVKTSLTEGTPIRSLYFTFQRK